MLANKLLNMPGTFRSRKLFWLAPVFLLGAATFAVYGQVYAHHFVWDTIPFVLENPLLQHPGRDEFIAMFTTAHQANWHPLVMLSHSLDFYLFGSNAGGHHLVNVLIHGINSCLLYMLVSAILAAGGQLDLPRRRLASFLTALIFAVHPQHVESVAWVVERKDVLYVMFALLSVFCYLRRHRLASPARWQRALPFVFFVLAVMSKPMAVTLPVVLLLIDVHPLGRCPRLMESMPRLIAEKWMYWLAAAVVVVITLETQSIAMPDGGRLPLWVRSLNAIDNVLFYLHCYVVPINLSPLYPYPDSLETVSAPAYWLPGALLIVVVTAGTGIMWYRGRRWPALLWLFYLVTLAPVSGLIHVGPAKGTDHYTYLATLPVGLLFSLAVARLMDFRATRAAAAALAIFVPVSLGMLAYQQVKVWRSPVTLWTYTTRLHPDSALAHRNLAAALLRGGLYGPALQHAERSLALGGPVEEYVRELRALVAEMEESAR